MSTPHRADVLLICVTDIEVRAIFAELQEQCGRSPVHHHIEQKTYYDLGEVGGARVWLTRSEMGVTSRGGALTTAAGAIGALSPGAVVMVGLAFGANPRRQRIGDVLVARQLMLYDSQRAGTGPAGELVLVPCGDRATASERLIDRFRHGALDWPPAGGSAPAVRFGLLLSGDKLIDNRDFRGQLLRFEPEALGGEMEGAGLYLAASAGKVDWIVVKAICDWADGAKERGKERRQQLAARNAAAFTFHVLQQSGFAPGPGGAPASGGQGVSISVAGDGNIIAGRDMQLDGAALDQLARLRAAAHGRASDGAPPDS